MRLKNRGKKVRFYCFMTTLFTFLFVYFLLYFPTVVRADVLYETMERFHPVYAQHGMVATQEAIATEVGKTILQKGGNAVDAAVAVGFALAVTLPRAGNLGGGGFMLVWLNDAKKAVAINYRESAPSAMQAKLFFDKEGNVEQAKLTNSYFATGVPGTVAGLSLALKKYGTMKLADVIQPALQLARDGITVTPGLANALKNAHEHLKVSQTSLKQFYKPDGSVYQPGDVLKQPVLAQTLEMIAQQGPTAFYSGDIAKKIVADMEAHKGVMTLSDLQNYHATIVKPVEGEYQGYRIISMPPPSSGGVALIEILNMLKVYPVKNYGLNSAKSLHLLTEAMNLAYRDRNHYLGDPKFVEMPLKRLLSNDYARALARNINFLHHTPANQLSPKSNTSHEGRQTTHYSVADKDGNVVSNTYSLNFFFGNGHTVPGVGILLNNELADFTIKEGTPNPFGLIEGKANLIMPGKQPLSSMTPTIVISPDKQVIFATGTPGGSRIITTVLQVILNVIDHQLSIASAVVMPRIHSQLWPDEIEVEQGISDDTIEKLKQMGHKVVRFRAMGSAQTVMHKNDGFYGAADPRREGATAVGY